MWNSMNTKALAAAVLITAMIQGALLWQMNTIATEDALVSAPASAPAIRYVTLEPVVIVGKYKDAYADENVVAQAGNPPASDKNSVGHASKTGGNI
ncbi:MAG: hypothetical protein WCH35_03800 [Comamonadaceae bacterium]